MSIITVTVPQDCEETRIGVFLKGVEGIPSRTLAERLISNGRITVNGELVPKNYSINEGDVIVCDIPAPSEPEALPEDIPLEVLYEDDSLLVLNKPRGLVVHPAAGNWTGTLVNALLFHCKGRLSGIGNVLRPGIVHRLDKDTSGLMVVAKSDAAHVGLASQFALSSVTRVYNAVCFGSVKQDRMKIDAPIARHSVDRTKMAVVDESDRKQRHAVTYIDVMHRWEKYTLFSARLETGRTHQIRVHMAFVGHPLLGDTVYTKRVQPESILGEHAEGQILHASHLEFIHPITGESMAYNSPWPEYFKQVVEELGNA